jgi:hypothetical protein
MSMSFPMAALQADPGGTRCCSPGHPGRDGASHNTPAQASGIVRGKHKSLPGYMLDWLPQCQEWQSLGGLDEFGGGDCRPCQGDNYFLLLPFGKVFVETPSYEKVIPVPICTPIMNSKTWRDKLFPCPSTPLSFTSSPSATLMSA